ncbi:hypothetical protein L2E82_48290 [Cichorium intybus]|uniref:Uncharacterized protein n=1 Tax=Cichorium intybus TaxID=13427 RepID=A0ACB8Z216_CICIN|nr:hypothetical protein L2E82_48290 [Cichorium intybus]
MKPLHHRRRTIGASSPSDSLLRWTPNRRLLFLSVPEIQIDLLKSDHRVRPAPSFCFLAASSSWFDRHPVQTIKDPMKNFCENPCRQKHGGFGFLELLMVACNVALGFMCF